MEVLFVKDWLVSTNKVEWKAVGTIVLGNTNLLFRTKTGSIIYTRSGVYNV